MKPQALKRDFWLSSIALHKELSAAQLGSREEAIFSMLSSMTDCFRYLEKQVSFIDGDEKMAEPLQLAINPAEAAKTISVKDREHWHEIRRKNIGASEVSALFDANPFMSYYQLWHLKNGSIPSLDMDSERVFWGNALEEGIARGIADRRGWKVRNVQEYTLHPTVEGMGASLDFEITEAPFGPAALEIKNVDFLKFHEKWLVHDEESVEAPLNYELQLQHQLACRPDLEQGVLGALVGGNQHYIVMRPRHNDIIKEIEDRVGRFWESIKAGDEPKPLAGDDYEVVSRMFRQDNGSVLELPENEELIKLIRDYKQIAAEDKILWERKKAIQAHIGAIMGEATELRIGGVKAVTWKVQKKKAYEVKASESRVMRFSEV